MSAIGVIVAVLAAIAGLGVMDSYHEVPEGHLGVYWFGGAMLERVTEPGFHFKLPFVERVAHVQYTLQTDTVRDIPCGTSGGVLIYFDKIEVVNVLDKKFVYKTIKQFGVDYDKTWIFDKIHHEINQFCSSHSLQEVYIEQFEKLDEALASSLQQQCNEWETGIKIVAIRVTKPRIPDSVRKNYEAVEESKTQLMVAEQTQRVRRAEEETKRVQAKIRAEMEAETAIINARKEAEVSLIESEKIANQSKIRREMEIFEKEAEKTMALIENEISVARQRAAADSTFYSLTTEAEALSKKLTPEYLKYTLYTSLANNTKIFFGEKIPQIFLDFLGEKHRGDVMLN
eukprot:TRINITY_DN4227_c0_g1_i1.p2 TRINITY_DN4227_c0_g1~~TRINITY_DN4227_c0_g1_i1.p2  ORF type:complete len:343 (+),score=166.41 TRINITY_DN4227_c0_g1_i1:46-1074(+)